MFDMRCAGCNKLLMKINRKEPVDIKANLIAVIETKCPRCGEMNYVDITKTLETTATKHLGEIQS